MKKSLIVTALIGVLVFCFSAGASASAAVTFTDVNNDAWYAEAVTDMAEYGIIVGYDDNTFRPDNSITRAEFAAMLARIVDYETPKTVSTSALDNDNVTFTDVNEGSWYYDAVMQLANKGYIHGYTDGTFQPDKAITREEIAYLLYNVVMINDLSPSSASAPEDAYMYFNDVLADRWSADAINTLTAYGLFSGYPDGTFRPAANATRAEAVSVLYHTGS